MRTYQQTTAQTDHRWYIVDAAGRAPWHACGAQIARALSGKHKPTWTPHIDDGDHVIVVNAEKIELGGKKWKQKLYYRHSNYPGGLKVQTAREIARQASRALDRESRARHARDQPHARRAAAPLERLYRRRASARGAESAAACRPHFRRRYLNDAVEVIQSTGRRKRAVARVKLMLGQGVITVNGKPVDEYFPRPQLLQIVRQPLEATQSGLALRRPRQGRRRRRNRPGRRDSPRHRARAAGDRRVAQRDASQERFPHARSARKRIEEVRPQARPQALPVQQTLRAALAYALKLVAIALGAVALIVAAARGLDRTRLFQRRVSARGSTSRLPSLMPLPWSLGDVAALAGVAAIVWQIVDFRTTRDRAGGASCRRCSSTAPRSSRSTRCGSS